MHIRGTGTVNIFMPYPPSLVFCTRRQWTVTARISTTTSNPRRDPAAKRDPPLCSEFLVSSSNALGTLRMERSSHQVYRVVQVPRTGCSKNQHNPPKCPTSFEVPVRSTKVRARCKPDEFMPLCTVASKLVRLNLFYRYCSLSVLKNKRMWDEKCESL